MPAEPLEIPIEATCLKCGYALRDLTEPRCPECGQPFVPGDFKTYQCNLHKTYIRRRAFSPMPIIAFAITTLVAGLLIAYLRTTGQADFGDGTGIFAVIPAVAIGLIARSFVRESVGIKVSPEELQRQHKFRRRTCIFAVVMSCVISFDVWTCPHGTGIKIGPCVLTITDSGGMCRNHLRLAHRYQLSERLSFYFTD